MKYDLMKCLKNILLLNNKICSDEMSQKYIITKQ